MQKNQIKIIFYKCFRTKWEIEIKATGQAGHGMLLHENTAAEKLHYVIGKFFNFRKGECGKMEQNPKLTIGDVTTVNLTMISGGTQGKHTTNSIYKTTYRNHLTEHFKFAGNVVPPEMSAVFDIRLANDVDLDAFERMVRIVQ